MGLNIDMSMIIGWVTYLFPTTAEYIKVLVPLVILLLNVLGIFSNLLPEPGKMYRLPTREDLESELKPNGIIVYRMTVVSLVITRWINRIICSKLYYWFYHTTMTVSRIVKAFRGTKPKSGKIKISPPKPYRIDFDRKDAKK